MSGTVMSETARSEKPESNINDDLETESSLELALSQIIEPSLVINKPDLENEFQQLLFIAKEALNFGPPRYIQSVLGPVKQWLPPHDKYSEF